MDDQQLEKLLKDLESDRVERKASLSDRGKLREAICAFANDLPNHQKPGVIFIGINDDGSCANLSITDDLLLTLSDMRSDSEKRRSRDLPFDLQPLPSASLDDSATCKGSDLGFLPRKENFKKMAILCQSSSSKMPIF